jgi:hypothetical protein
MYADESRFQEVKKYLKNTKYFFQNAKLAFDKNTDSKCLFIVFEKNAAKK